MTLFRKSLVVFLTIFIGILFFLPQLTFGQFMGNSLKQAIDEKTNALFEIQKQKEEVEKNLEETGTAKKSLSRDLKNIDATVSQLNLSIKSNKILIEKLALEGEDLENQISDTEENISDKKGAINKIILALQQKSRENIVTVILKNKTLSEGIAETEALSNLHSGLTQGVSDLVKYQEELDNKLEALHGKKQTKEREKINLANRQIIIVDQKKEKEKILSETKNKEKIYEQKLTELEKLQAEISVEVAKIEAELRKNIDPNLLPIPRPGVLAWPVPEGRLTQGYGRTPFAIKTYKSQLHNGIDIGRFLGAEIIAAEDGVIINVGNQDNYCRGGAYGKFIVIKHENGLTTLYGHLSKYIVSLGQKVKRGDVIGYMGHSGWAYGNHLHFTVFASNTLTPTRPGFPEGTQATRVCGPMPVGGDLDPNKYL